MSKYKSYTTDQIDELLSNFLVNSWSYSKVTTFARHEKAFECTEIYGCKFKRSVSSITGNAYHKSLQYYFTNLALGNGTPLIDAERVAFSYIDDQPDDVWKLGKTTPTIDECRRVSSRDVSVLLRNFYKEASIYTDDIAEILGVELRCSEWVTVNGVDIPLPCSAIIDLVVKLHNGRIVIIDHKTKSKTTDDKDLYFTFGKQSITYVKCLEAKLGCTVDEVWAVENKLSQNRDGGPQLKRFKIELNENTRRLYEVALYEPLRRMVEAVSNPDYIYLINDNDTFVDIAEVYEFWAKTLISEVDDFEVDPTKRAIISKRQKKIRDSTVTALNPKVIASFKENAASFITYDLKNTDMTQSEKVEHLLRTFGKIVNVAHEIDGYSSDTFLLEMSSGTKISDITKYPLDIANILDVPNVRMGKSLMVYNEKSYLYFEVAKKRTRDLPFDAKYLSGSKLPIGQDNFNNTIYWDLDNHSTPHILMCGATGSGKSVCIRSTIEYAILSGVSDIIIFDPKYEFTKYKEEGLRVYNEIEDIEGQMKILVEDMQLRTKKGVSKKTLIIFDEFADAVQMARSGVELDIKEKIIVGYYKPQRLEDGTISERIPKYKMQVVGRHKSLEENLRILLQKGRSLGFRIMAATQRASVQVITGDAKVNFPVQICFRVPKEIDSKVVLDESGAEMLSGMGDGLIKSPEYLDSVRFQGFYKS